MHVPQRFSCLGRQPLHAPGIHAYMRQWICGRLQMTGSRTLLLTHCCQMTAARSKFRSKLFTFVV